MKIQEQLAVVRRLQTILAHERCQHLRAGKKAAAKAVANEEHGLQCVIDTLDRAENLATAMNGILKDSISEPI